MPRSIATRELQVYDPILTEVARQLRPHGFVGDQIAPRIPVTKISDQYPVFDERFFFSTADDNLLGDREETPEIDLVWSTDNFVCKDYGFKISITPRERQQFMDAFRMEVSKINLLMDRMALKREARLAAALRKTTNGGQLNLGGAATTAFATSTAVEADWKTAKLAVYNVTGRTPNVAVIPYAKAYDLATNATLRDIWKYIVNNDSFIRLGADENGEDIFLPRWFHGTKLVVPKGALQQSAHEGAAKSLNDIWGTSVRFLYVDPQAGWGVPSTAYQFIHPVLSADGQQVGDGSAGPVVDRWLENDPKKELVRAMECQAEKICAPDLGYELTGV